jgi:preprotein translocase subunit SecD
MQRELRWKIPLILATIVGSLWLILPLEKKIKLGLDLQGGTHLVLEVQIEKAVEGALERIADDIKRSVHQDNIEIGRLTVDIENLQVRVGLLDSADAPAVEKIMANYPYLEKKAITQEARDLVFHLSKDESKRIRENAVHQGLETIRNRIDQFGVSEPTIQIQGENRILVQLPGIDDPNRAISLIGKTARLEFKIVDDSVSVDEALKGNMPEGDQVLYQRVENRETKEVTRNPYLLKKRAGLTGETLTGAEVRFDSQFGEPYVAITFNSVGASLFYEVTKENIGKRMAIVLDDNVYSAPVIQDEISGGRAQITGSFTVEDAKDLAIILRAGALPAPVVILENRTVGPSLGKDSIRQGIVSFVVGMLLIMVFTSVYYRWSGVIAVTALLLNALLLMGALAYFGASLTLPGIAGIVLTVGIAIDANVLIFERIREEMRIGKTVRAAIDTGYAKAFLTILDANVTALIAAVVLFQFGTGPIKGFAITLCLGLVISMFTAVFVTRVVFDFVLSRRKIDKLSI